MNVLQADNLTEAEPLDIAAEAFLKEDYKYEAFISYRHLLPDAAVAARVQQIIETFRVPREFYVNGKRPVFRVFRDRDELSATDLSGSIDEALRNSKFLVVICSRATPLSEWCNREVEVFKSLHGVDRIIPVLIEGEPHESYPPALRGLTKTETTDTGEVLTRPHEILAAELRPKEVLDPAFAGYAQLNQSNPALVNALTQETLRLLVGEKYRIMAAILGCSYGDLKQRDKERRTRMALTLSTIIGLALLGFGIFMFRAYQQENIARREAVQSNSAMLFNTARNLIADGDKIKALLVASEAMKKLTPDMDRYEPLRAQHVGILNDAVYNANASLLTVINTENNMAFFGYSPDGNRLVTGYGNADLAVFDARTGGKIQVLTGHKAKVKVSVWSPDGKYLASSDFEGTTLVWNAETYEPVIKLEEKGVPMMCRFSRQGDTLITIHLNEKGYKTRFYQTGTWEPARPDLLLKFSIKDVEFNDDSTQLLAVSKAYEGNPSLERYDLKTGKVVTTYANPLVKDSAGIDQPQTLLGGILTRDGKYVLAHTRSIFLKMEAESGKEVYRVVAESTIPEDSTVVNLREYKDMNAFMAADNSNIYRIHLEEGKILSKTFVYGGVKIYRYHADSDTIAVLNDDGEIALIKNDVMTEAGLDYGSGAPDLMEIAPDGSRLFVASRAKKEIKIVDLLERNIHDTIAGQIVAVSPDNKRVLFFDSDSYFLWDNEKNVKADQPMLTDGESTSSHISGSWNIAIGPLGVKAAEPYTLYETDKDGKMTGKREDSIMLVDTATGENTKLETERAYDAVAFSPDGKMLAAVGYKAPILLIDVESAKIVKTIDTEFGTGTYLSIFFSENSKYLIFNTFEFTTIIYDLENEKMVLKMPGELFWVGKENGVLEARGIFANQGFIWTEQTGAKYHPFDKEIDGIPPSMDLEKKDIIRYHAGSNLLLIIRNGNDKPFIYLVDFDTGSLLKTFSPSLTQYSINGFIANDGKAIALDEYYFFSPKDPNSNDADSEYQTYMGSTQYNLFDYNTLLEKAGTVTQGRLLTPEERHDLGLE